MKKQIQQAGKFFSLTLAAAAFTSLTANAQLQANPELKVQFAGKHNNQPMFEIGCNKADAEPFVITIKDAEGYVFYEEVIKNNSYSKKFLVDIPESEMGDLIITLTDKKGNQKQVYKINNRTVQVSEYAITKV